LGKTYLRYLYALLAVPLVIILRFALMPLVGPGIPYITLFPVTVAVALLAGLGPAILTGIIGSIVTDYFFIEPLYSIDFDIAGISRMAVVTLTSVFVGYVGDVLRTARAKAEQQALALRDSQADLHRAQAVAHTGSWRLDIRQDKLTWSDEAYNIFDVPKGTPLTYESFISFIHPDDRQFVDTKWKAAMAGEKYDIEHRIIVDGQIKWVRERAELEIEKNGTLLGGFGTVTDITARKKMEDELRKSHDELEKRVQERTKELNTEIAERKKAEETVKAERQRLYNVLETLPVYVILLTEDYHVPFANRTFEERFGASNGRKCYEYLFGRNESCETCETYTVMKTGKPHHWEWTGPDRRNYDIFDFPFTDVDGSKLIMEMGIDITEQKQAEKAVRQGEERYRSLTVATTQIVWTTDAQGQVVGDMPSWRAFTGQSVEEIMGWGWINSLHPDDRDRTAKIWSQSVKTRTLYDTEYRLKRNNEEYRYVAVRGVPVLEQDGGIREWVGTCTDITEHKMSQQKQGITNSLLELFARKTLRKTYLDSTVEVIRDWSACKFIGIRIKDNDGNIPYESYVNFDKDFLTLENDLNMNRDKCVCIRAILQQHPYQQEQKFISGGGSFFCNDSQVFLAGLTDLQKKDYRGNCVKWGFQSIAVVPIRYHEQVLGAIHLADFEKDMVSLSKIQFIETTIAPLIGEAVQRFNAEAELEKYRLHLEEMVKQQTEELIRSNKDLEQFAYVASHDLQEPLRMIAGYTQLLQQRYKDKLDEDANQFILYTVDGVLRMQNLITDLLTYSRLETRSETFEPVDCRAVLDDVLATLQMTIEENNAVIKYGPLPTVRANKGQLFQLFQNLISNAIKFRSDKPPLINITAKPQDKQWLFSVSDNGIGMEPQYLERIFVIFQRLHTRDKYPGTGIGLAICKKIVERHGGRIWAESQPGKGSTFHFII